MYRCLDCGRILDDDELKTERSYVSDYMGGCYESFSCCPCGGDIEEVERCDSCGEYFTSDELPDGICLDCLKEYATVENALECGKDAKETIKINGFLASCFSSDEIEKLLLSALEERINSSDANAVAEAETAEDYCLDDASWFAGWLKERGIV